MSVRMVVVVFIWIFVSDLLGWVVMSKIFIGGLDGFSGVVF